MCPLIIRGTQRPGKWWAPKEREITVSSEVVIPSPKQLDVGDKGNDNPEVLEDTWYVCENTVCWKTQEATNK